MPYKVGWAVCRLCGHKHVSVLELSEDYSVEDNQECPNCHNMTVEFEENEE